MAQDEQVVDPSSKKKVSTKEKEKTKSKDKPPTKVLIRRLPPTMTEEVFLEQISPLPENDYFYYVKGEQHLGVPTFSRAYINFVNLEEIFTFQDKFDGYVFLDQKGAEYPAVVEFAPYQRIPRHQEAGAKEDKCNTLDSDQHYLEFLRKLEHPEEIVLPSAETYLEQIELKEREMKANGYVKITTPLVEFIQQRRLDREKFREEKKDERRRKEFEKKKQRELERLNKKRESKNKDDKKIDKQILKGKKEDGRPPNPVKVLKNTERDSVEKHDKAEGSVTNKKVKETSTRTKTDKVKDRPPKEKSKPKSEKKQMLDSGETVKSEAKQETPHSLEQQQTKTAANKDDSASKSDNANEETFAKAEEEKSSKNETEKTGERDKKIRNKDRPAIQIYRPGAKRMVAQKDEASATNQSTSSSGMKREVKTRTFSRSSAKE